MGMVAASMDVGQNLTVKQGQFLNSEGEVYAIVHQYDRHKVLHYDLSNNRFYAQDEYGGRHDDFTFQLSS
jgi:hypothetical protein